MAELAQEPGELNLTATHTDDFSFSLTFDIDLTGYSFSAKVIQAVSNTPIAITVTNTSLPDGEILLTLDSKTLCKLAVGVQHHWYLDWTVSSKSRRVLAGTFTVVDYP